MENVISEQQLQSLKIFITQSCTEEAQSYTELVFFKPLDAIVFEGVFLWKIDDGKCEMENGQKTEEYWNADSADPFRKR